MLKCGIRGEEDDAGEGEPRDVGGTNEWTDASTELFCDRDNVGDSGGNDRGR